MGNSGVGKGGGQLCLTLISTVHRLEYVDRLEP